jgi:hypothetical protein
MSVIPIDMTACQTSEYGLSDAIWIGAVRFWAPGRSDDNLRAAFLNRS